MQVLLEKENAAHLLCARWQSALGGIEAHQIHSPRDEEGQVHGRVLPFVDIVHYEHAIGTVQCPTLHIRHAKCAQHAGQHCSPQRVEDHVVQELLARGQAHLQDSCPNHSSPLMPMNVNATFSIGSRGMCLAQGNSNQPRALYGDLPLDNMYVLKIPMSHQVAHPKKNQPGNMWPRCPPCIG